MKTSKHQNPIRLVTTISVYLGLVLVGASPQVIAQANLSGDAQSRIFELSSRSGSVFSKFKLRQEIDQNEVISFPVSSPTGILPAKWSRVPGIRTAEAPKGHVEHTNDQIFVVSMLARASI